MDCIERNNTSAVLEVRTVKNIEDWLACQRIRAQAFGPDEPYREEFTADFEGVVLEILVCANGIPLGCARAVLIQVSEGGIVEWGRLAIRHEVEVRAHRYRILNALYQELEAFTLKQGFRKAQMEVANERLISFLHRKGFRKTNEGRLYGSGRFYHRLVREYFPEGSKSLAA